MKRNNLYTTGLANDKPIRSIIFRTAEAQILPLGGKNLHSRKLA